MPITSEPTRIGDTSKPTGSPSTVPSGAPSSQPTARPSARPTGQPSCEPSGQPTEQPSVQPSSKPSGQPSVQPSVQPSSKPSSQPTTQPSSEPTSLPTTAEIIVVRFPLKQPFRTTLKASAIKASPEAKFAFTKSISSNLKIRQNRITITDITDGLETTRRRLQEVGTVIFDYTVDIQVQNTITSTLADTHTATVESVTSSALQMSLETDMNLALGENVVESITPTVKEFSVEDVEVIQLRTPQSSASPTEVSVKVASKESNVQSTLITASSVAGVLLIAALVYRMRTAIKMNNVVPSLPPQQEPVLAAVVPGDVEESVPKDVEPPAGVDKEMILESDKLDEIVETPDLDMMENGLDTYQSLSSDTEEPEQQPEAPAIISVDPPNLEEMENGNQGKVVFGQLSSSSDSLWTSSSDAEGEMVLEIANEAEPQEANSFISLSSDTEDEGEVVNGEEEIEKLDDFLAELATTTEEDISSLDSL